MYVASLSKAHCFSWISWEMSTRWGRPQEGCFCNAMSFPEEIALKNLCSFFIFLSDYRKVFKQLFFCCLHWDTLGCRAQCHKFGQIGRKPSLVTRSAVLYMKIHLIVPSHQSDRIVATKAMLYMKIHVILSKFAQYTSYDYSNCLESKLSPFMYKTSARKLILTYDALALYATFFLLMQQKLYSVSLSCQN